MLAELQAGIAVLGYFRERSLRLRRRIRIPLEMRQLGRQVT